jgi:hypothetical protein
MMDEATLALAGVPPLRTSLEDVATPYVPFTGMTDALDCTTDGPDGLTDLVLHFDIQAIVEALGDVSNGEVPILELTGNLLPPAGINAIVGEVVVV